MWPFQRKPDADPGALHRLRHGVDLPEETSRKSLSAEQLAEVRSKPDAARRMLEIVNSGDRLITFAERLWSVLDPGVPFVRGWAIEAIAEHLEAVTKGWIKKLLINVPPGFSKSLLTCVYWPAWEWGPMKRPHERYITTSYDQTLVIRDNIRCRNLILSEDYQLAWGDRFKMADDQNTKVRFSNDKTGWKAAKAITGLTGDRGSRFIFDDPQSVLGAQSEAETETTEQSFAHAMPTRVQTKDDAFVGITQRIKENDISGFILSAAKRLGYEHLCIPMHYNPAKPHPFISVTSLKWVDPRADESPTNPARGYYRVTRDAQGREVREWVSSWHVGMVETGYLASPDRFPPEAVDDTESIMATKGGTAAIAGQLEQRPYPDGGSLFSRDWFKVWDKPVPAGAVKVRGWDFAASINVEADWTVAVLIARVRVGERADGSVIHAYIVEDIRRFRKKPGGVRIEIKSVAARDTRRVYISVPMDPGPGGEWAAGDIVNDLAGWQVHTSREDKNKEIRAKPWAAQAEMGHAYIAKELYERESEQVRGKSVAAVYLDELVAFPNGTWDDQVDGSSRAFGRLTEIPEPSGVAADPVEIDVTADVGSIYEVDSTAIHDVGYDP